jgi:hypothetical protein
MAKRTGGFIGQDGINAPDPATGVTGTAGDQQVTVSWTDPTDVGGAAITRYSVQSNDGTGTIDLFSSSTYEKQYDSSAEESYSNALCFNNDGTKMYVTGSSDEYVFQYSLTTAFDVGTASYDSKSFQVTSQDSDPRAIMFNSNGTKFYMAGINSGGKIFQYSLSTAYDISTASYDSVNFSFSSQDPYPTAATFNNNGTKMFMLGVDNNNVYEYSLSSAYNISTLSYTTSFSVSSQAIDGQGLAFNADGTKMYYSKDGGSAAVYRYSLSSAFDISTASYDSESYNWFGTTTDGSSLQFSNDDSKFYLVSSGADAVYQFAVGTEVTASPVIVSGLTNDTSYTFNVWAINPFGWSSPSDASGSVTPALQPTGDVGLFGGGATNKDTIEWITITSTGNAADFGDLTVGRQQLGACGGSTRGFWIGGESPASTAIDTVVFTTKGNATDFGDTSSSYVNNAGASNSTRGLTAGLNATSAIQYFTIGTTGSVSNFGNLTTNRDRLAAVASSTRAVFLGGENSSNVNQDLIDYVTISSTGNASSFGTLSSGVRDNWSGCSNATRGLAAGGATSGSSSSNIIDYITIASTGNSSDFGDLTNTIRFVSACANSTRGVFAGGQSATNVIQYVTIASTGNATDFGDLTAANDRAAGCSNAHGGLS